MATPDTPEWLIYLWNEGFETQLMGNQLLRCWYRHPIGFEKVVIHPSLNKAVTTFNLDTLRYFSYCVRWCHDCWPSTTDEMVDQIVQEQNIYDDPDRVYLLGQAARAVTTLYKEIAT